MNELNDILQRFNPITLEEMGGVRLMNRTDTKFVTTRHQLVRLLGLACGSYRAQEIGGRRMARYYTLYFDTPQHSMYIRHETGCATRQKLRIRSYVDSSLNFLEVKTKNNHGRTSKRRVAVDGFSPSQHVSLSGYGSFLCHTLHYEAATLTEHVENRFSRITLVNNALTERLTIDTGLSFHNLQTGHSLSLPEIVVIELKRDGLAPSPILDMLRSLRIKPMGFSKYCVGAALTNSSLPHNMLKPRLHRIMKMEALAN